MAKTESRSSGMRTFIIIWIGQILSLLGTALSHFGMSLWVYDASEKATPMTLIGLFFTLPMVVFTPVVGVLVDRANRKLMMMLSDLAAALTTLIMLVLYATGNLQIWHLYITAFISGTFQGFQWPAYSAALSTMLDKKDYTRANAMLQMVGPASNIFAPMIAVALLSLLDPWMARALPGMTANLSGRPGLVGLLALDLISAAFAVGSLLIAHIPQPKASKAGEEARGNLLQEALYGWRYIAERPSLMGLQLVFLVGNLFSTLGYSIFMPMVLARTGSDELVLGSVQTAGAVGGLVGGILLSAWGGFKRQVHGVLAGWAISGVSMVALGLSRSLPAWVITGFLSALIPPLINASNQAIWQTKVPPDVQGRVFATRRLIAWMVSPVGQALSGPLADYVLEPAMQEGGALAPALGWLVGRGPGAGMGLQFVITGLFSLLVGLAGYRFPAIRNAEEILPDHDAVDASPEPQATAEAKEAPGAVEPAAAQINPT